jgi:Abortive infection alpha
MNDLVPFTDEQAKLFQELVKSGRDVGSYFASILGDTPKDLVALLVGNRLKIQRAEQLAKLWAKAQERLREQGIYDPVSPNPKLAIPILTAAADENREQLQNLWAALLAASMNPNKETQLRLAFIERLQKLDPPDAKIITYFSGDRRTIADQDKDKTARELGLTLDELLVSVRNLQELYIASDNGTQVALTPFGREFLRCVAS